MLDRLIVRNFKRFEEVEIELGQVVVFIGPNNSGKTSALQALALWELGLRRWYERRGDKPPKKRPGVTINRRDLVTLPVPDANLLWRDLHVRDSRKEHGKQRTDNVLIEVEVRGIDEGRTWTCGLEFDYANQESLYCRPLGWNKGERSEEPTPAAARNVRVAYLPPMSGLTANEVRLDPGAVQVRLGEGRTAEVLRNLSYSLATSERGREGWAYCVERIRALFGVQLLDPEYVVERGELTLRYRHDNRVELDITAAGRGLQQTLLLLAFLMGNPGSVLLLDEPDAHLEVLRQRQIYDLLSATAVQQGCQIVAASHSEVILNAAGDRDVVVAFVGRPHRIDDRGAQVAKALRSIGFDHYYLAERRGWVLYLEGETDLAILRGFAATLQHAARVHLEEPFHVPIGNQPSEAFKHFGGVREAKSDLVGFVLVDRIDRPQQTPPGLRYHEWARREIENYLCYPEVLEEYARLFATEQKVGPLFTAQYPERMREAVHARIPPAALQNRADPWWSKTRASEEFLDLVFQDFFAKLGLPNLMRKTDYHRLASLVPRTMIDDEVVQVLDGIAAVAERANPRTSA